jgi:DNA repair exonuclease SbcCD ATPase subunit
MKKLTKILLINWLYFSKQLIEVDSINFLTGKTGAGKSTVIDALQIVLLGELNARNFNKAANESSQRTLDSYLRADMDDKNPKSRRGKDFSSYIACQFLDDQTGAQFVSGIVFDCRNDGSRREQFFIYNGIIPEHCFLIDRHAMDIAALRGYLKTLTDARETFFDSNTRYRNDLLAKWNVHNEQVCRMLKKAVSFRPIVDIQQFITENICDIPEKPDIESMQQNIRDYKRHELLAQRQERKLIHLKEISRLFHEMQASIDRSRVQRFLVLWAQQNDLAEQIERLSVNKRDCVEGIEKSHEKYEALNLQIINLDNRKNELITDRAKSDVFQEENRKKKKKTQLQHEQRQLMEQLNAMALEIRRETHQLHSLCEEILSWTGTELTVPLQEAAASLQNCCQPLISCAAEIFSGAITPLEAAQEAVHGFSACLRNTAYQ